MQKWTIITNYFKNNQCADFFPGIDLTFLICQQGVR